MRTFVTDPGKTGIIAEFKRRSPSLGLINGLAQVEETSKGYIQAGASALSILTDQEFFGGSNDDLIQARKSNICPILRKDFIIDEYQIIEARSIGADCILLIAAALDPVRLKALAMFAQELGLEVLMEVHNEEELDRSLNGHLDLIGINNRNLKNFELSLDTSYSLVDKIPAQFVKISESGISRPQTLIELRSVGFDGFLIGGNFMKSSKPQESAYQFMQELKKLQAGQDLKPN